MIDFLGNMIASAFIGAYLLVTLAFPFLAVYGLIQLFS